jgi:hypothetical protein
MNEHSDKILVVLVFTMAIHQLIAQVVSLQQVAITQHWSMMSALFFFRFCEHAIKSLGHMQIWKSRWTYEESISGEFFREDVSTTYKVKLWHILCFD